MKTKYKKLSLAIALVLATALSGELMAAAGGSTPGTVPGGSGSSPGAAKKADGTDVIADPCIASPKSVDVCSTAPAGSITANGKITICHVPPGNPANAHVITISPNAVIHPHQEQHHGDSYWVAGDTCGGGAAAEVTEQLRVVSNATGSARQSLLTAISNYYMPVVLPSFAVINDRMDPATAASAVVTAATALNTAIEECTDPTKGKGTLQPSNPVSTDVNLVVGCQGSYLTTLKTAYAALVRADSTVASTSAVIVPDSALSNSSVLAAYKACTASASDANKIDTAQTNPEEWALGQKFYIVSVTSSGDTGCTTAQATTLTTALAAAQTANTSGDITLTDQGYNASPDLKSAVDTAASGTGASTSLSGDSVTHVVGEGAAQGASGLLNQREKIK